LVSWSLAAWGLFFRDGEFKQMSSETYWLRVHHGREIRVLSGSPYDGDVLVRVEGQEERCVTSGEFEQSGGSYGWRAVLPPGDGWALDREASARKDYRVAYWRRQAVKLPKRAAACSTS
jgi:hypothetical protein